ncbi:CAMK family protein kinase [Trichomonas vaginalis G3]|uniref:non-specific serine/threonine protein kinase n=1 Tax=Trichomonas vaginalis (strain ATCC PRA-98 / G3) TaxID=412133 RepID=A2E0S1_TRIV3|nr:CAMK family protein kinase [Trichomonas vaginalis G3]|eukprot:XP_001326039.1 CAMK family protein kinase [Trichomonas vaginalis G3]
MKPSPVLGDYSIQSNIGSGAFAKVFMAIHNTTGSVVAIKMIPKNLDIRNGTPKPIIDREVRIMRRVKHPYIADFYDVIHDTDCTYLVMEYAHNGTLLNYINQYGPFSEQDAAPVFAQLIVVMKFLQKKCNIAHRDIKAENILFDINKNIRLIDFGFSRNPDDGQIMNTQCGSPMYASPELIMGQKYSFSSDIWSCGIVLYAMVCGRLPFSDTNYTRLAHNIILRDIQYPPNLSPSLMDLFKRLLDKNPQTRISIDDLSTHPWIGSFVRIYEERVARFRYNHDYISTRMTMFGYNLEQTLQDIKNHKHNKATVSYEIIAREFMTNYFQSLVDPRKRMHNINRYSSDRIDEFLIHCDQKLNPANKYKSLNCGSFPTIVMFHIKFCQNVSYSILSSGKVSQIYQFFCKSIQKHMVFN